ncbi:hypothetical protein BDR26DRAFT_859565 [Obelidium mucronatum]|nr:hypothetical protein BDR26DRAFT_859565 [Obelidium mucronatum]
MIKRLATRHFATSQPVFSKELLANYPIRLLDLSESRRGYFEQFPGAPWHERSILMPMRLKMAFTAGTGFINGRFGTPSTLHPEAKDSPDFFPDQFQDGVKYALPAVIERLSGWDGDLQSPQGLSLRTCVADGLLTELSKAHQGLFKECVILNLKWNHNKTKEDAGEGLNVTPKHFWITFGEEHMATSTLLRGPVTSRYHLVAFTRKIITKPTAGKLRPSSSNGLQIPLERKIFREICFEYVYEPGELEGDEDAEHGVMAAIPDFQWKRKVMMLGQVLAIDSDVSGSDMKLGYSLTQVSDGAVVASGSVDLDGISVRMETSHFVKEFPEDGSWKVADLDNFLIHPRVLEEEKGL